MISKTNESKSKEKMYLIGLLTGVIIGAIVGGVVLDITIIDKLNDKIQSLFNQIDISGDIVNTLIQSLNSERNLTSYWRNQTWIYSNSSTQKDDYIRYLESQLRSAKSTTLLGLNTVEEIQRLVMLNMSYFIHLENFALNNTQFYTIPIVTLSCDSFTINKTLGTFYLEIKNGYALMPNILYRFDGGTTETIVLSYTQYHVGYILIDGTNVGEKIVMNIVVSDLEIKTGDLDSLGSLVYVPYFSIIITIPEN